MPPLNTIKGLPKKFIDLSKYPCPREQELRKAEQESIKATKQ